MKKAFFTVVFAVYNTAVRAASWVKRELLRVEVLFKSFGAAAFAGGLNSVYAIYSSGKSFELTAVHLLEVKSKFISGAAIGVLMYLVKSPLGKKLS